MKRIARATFAAALALGMTTLSTSALARPTQYSALVPTCLADAEEQLIWSTNTPSYWESLPYQADIWKGGKVVGPESQRRLVHEERATPVSFGSVVFVKAGDVPYVYFVANYDNAITYLKRVPLAGGASSIVSRTPYIGARDSISDGAFLYWADAEGVRRIALTGGSITTLHRSTTSSQLALDANYLYFNAGSGASIDRVPKAGGAVTLQASGWNTVTDLALSQSGAQATLYWSDSHADVASQAVGSNVTNHHQLPMDRHRVSSVAFDGARLFWTDCDTFTGVCETRQQQNGTTLALYGKNGGELNYQAGNLVANPGGIYWGTAQEILSYVHTAPPTVSFDPALIRGSRVGSGGVTALAHVVPMGGDPPYRYDYRIDNPVFRVDVSPSGPSVPVYAPVAACDSLDAQLKVTVYDAIGRQATAVADVVFSASRPVGGVCP